MKLFRKLFFQRKTPTFEHKNGISTHVSRREEIKNNKFRKKGMIK